MILNLKLELCLGVCEIVVKFWGIVVYINEIGDMCGVAVDKEKLKVEERKWGRIQMQFLNFAQKKNRHEFNYQKLSGCPKDQKFVL